MKNRTDEEILTKLAQVFKCDRLDQPKFEVTRRSDGAMQLQIGKMYDAPILSFNQLDDLARFFDTKNVETESEFAHGGCETCDYGSEYGFILLVREGESFETQPTEPT